MRFKTRIFLASLLLSSSIYADSSPEPDDLNTDGSQFQAPRLAGDSLPIAGFKQGGDSKGIHNINDAFKNGTVKGLLRYSGQYRDSNLHLTQDGVIDRSSDSKKQQYTAIGGYLGYETAPWFNTSVGATFYTAQKAGNNPDSRLGLGGLNEDGGTSNSYAVLGEAFVKFKTDEHRVMVGRQEMPNYRFISLSNIRFSPFTHQGATYENTVIDGLQFNLAYIQKQKDRNAEDFEDMVRAARVKTGCGGAGVNPVTGHCAGSGKAVIRGGFNRLDYVSGNYEGQDKAMPMAAAVYKKNGVSLEAWDYYVEDFINTVYLYGDYTIEPTEHLNVTAAFQYASQNDVGDSVAGDVNTWFYGLKVQASHDNGITYFGAYNEVKYDENSYDGGSIFVRWGTPQMFNSFQVQDSELAGVKSYGAGLQFELGKIGIIPNTVIRFRYADYNYPDHINQRDARQDRTETTFDLRYSFTKNDGFGIFTQMDGLSVQFRVAYDDYRTDYNFNEYARVNNYTFDSVTDDFIDWRLYLDYVF